MLFAAVGSGKIGRMVMENLSGTDGQNSNVGSDRGKASEHVVKWT